ncbi:hypothetical protein PRIPAC_86574, partial [Pristionchus pacificus]|uniref:Uncharacterized protein n=1 Tax=Pristionchus pacificus TaxID=54126 RepID=A0A2A6BS07_PRIPA
YISSMDVEEFRDTFYYLFRRIATHTEARDKHRLMILVYDYHNECRSEPLICVDSISNEEKSCSAQRRGFIAVEIRLRYWAYGYVKCGDYKNLPALRNILNDGQADLYTKFHRCLILFSDSFTRFTGVIQDQPAFQLGIDSETEAWWWKKFPLTRADLIESWKCVENSIESIVNEYELVD